MACSEPQFLELNEAIKETELRKQKTETGDTNAPIEDHVQKFNTEEDYDSEVVWNNGFMLEEHVQIQKDNPEEAKKEEEKERKEAYDSDEDMGNSVVEDPNTKTVHCLTNASLKWYNKQTGSKYKLKRVLEATATLVNGLTYEIRFIAEEGGSDEPALEYLEFVNGPDEKVVYNSGDDKPSDKLFEGAVYWMRSGYIEVLRCEITTKEEVQIRKDNPEEANKYLQAYHRKMKKKHIRTPRNLGRSLNGPKNRCAFFMWKDAAFWVHQCILKNKKQKILWLALGICFYYIIWAVLSKTKE